jgi:serine/threonine-protein kinase
MMQSNPLTQFCGAANDSLGQALLERAWLTPFQVSEIQRGRGKPLTLGPYVVLGQLGQGSTGTVFKARHSRMRRLAAVKLLHPGVLDRFGGIDRFLREVQTAARLDHPNVVHAYDADFTAEAHYLAMEYVEGPDLRRLVTKEGPLDVALACDYVRQAALGLQHAHERGVIHRDVKPSNLLVCGAVVKLTDFGLALLPGQERAGRVVGTPGYLAPEQALEPRSTDERADLYSLGCTLYFLLTGRVPFPGDSPIDKLLRQLREEPEPVEEIRSSLPRALCALVRKLMVKRPEDRFQTAAEVANALANCQCRFATAAV